MTRDDIIRMAREAGISQSHAEGMTDFLERFAALVAAAERNKVAQWMIDHSYATGHGDTTEDLLKELEWQVRESEREACIRDCDSVDVVGADDCIAAIRARGQA
jgi:hypothetical protein